MTNTVFLLVNIIRMLVITTNYPEKLDKALIRPGRIDMKVLEY